MSDQQDSLLTLSEIAVELRCSKAHASKILAGKIRGLAILPSIRLGNRPVVRRSTLETWKAANETGTNRALLPPPERSPR